MHLITVTAIIAVAVNM